MTLSIIEIRHGKGAAQKIAINFIFSIIQGKLKTYISLCGDNVLTLITLSVCSLITLYAISEQQNELQFVFTAT